MWTNLFFKTENQQLNTFIHAICNRKVATNKQHRNERWMWWRFLCVIINCIAHKPNAFIGTKTFSIYKCECEQHAYNYAFWNITLIVHRANFHAAKDAIMWYYLLLLFHGWNKIISLTLHFSVLFRRFHFCIVSHLFRLRTINTQAVPSFVPFSATIFTFCDDT